MKAAYADELVAPARGVARAQARVGEDFIDERRRAEDVSQPAVAVEPDEKFAYLCSERIARFGILPDAVAEG